MSSVREEILDELETTLAGISSINQVIKRKSPLPELDSMDLPAAFIKVGNATKILDSSARPVSFVVGKETWEWNIVIGIYMQYSEEETLLKDVSDAIYANYRFGGHALFSDRVGDEILMIDPANDFKALLLDYKIYYRHVSGDL